GHALGGSARITNAGGMLLIRGREHHIHEFVLVLGRHDDEVRHATQETDVEQPMMSRAIVGGETGAVHAKDYWQILEGNIVNDAIVSALQKGRVNGADRMKSHRG